MKIRKFLIGVSILAGLALPTAFGQERAAKHEVGLTLGGLFSQDRQSGPTKLELASGKALQANYGYRFLEGSKLALYGEIHFLASPLREVTSTIGSATRDVASAFVTPGIRLKFFPRAAAAPYLAIGGGLSVFEHSTTSLDGLPNSASRTTRHGAFNYGGGMDFRFWRFVGLRAEIRDFYTGGPSYNLAAISGSQHNLVAGGGIVLKFGQ